MISKYSIAVLPFVNMSSDKENEYFSDGITEEILNALSRLEGLHVTARTSSFAFKNVNTDIREIGRRLNVSLILEGSIRKSKDLVRITAQLTEAENGFHLWSETWDREIKDIFVLQDEIATNIADKINKDIKPGSGLNEHVMENTKALDYYLKAKYLQNKWDFNDREQIIQYYEKALELDPLLLNAYAGLSDMYTWLSSTGFVSQPEAFSKINHYIEKMLAIDNHFPDAYRIMAGKNFWIEWDIPLALKNITIAIEGKPSFPDALVQKGLIMATMGRMEEAFDIMFLAERLNPFDRTANYSIGYLYHLTGEYAKAIEYNDKNIKLNPNWDAQYLTKAEALCLSGRFKEAWITINKVSVMPNIALSENHLKTFYFACRNDKENANKYLNLLNKELEKTGLTQSFYSPFLAQLYMLLGDKKKALDYLEEGVKFRSAPLQFLKSDYFWNELRHHHRFQALVNKITGEKQGIFDQKNLSNKKYKKTSITKEQAKNIENRVNEIMNTQKSYLTPSLSLYDLAELAEVSVNQLSQVLNEFVGKNYYDFVNTFRLQEFMKLRNNPKYKNYTILALVYESGFNSKTTFNSFFKRTYHQTPSEYFRNINK